jgi:hypothetical protein
MGFFGRQGLRGRAEVASLSAVVRVAQAAAHGPKLVVPSSFRCSLQQPERSDQAFIPANSFKLIVPSSFFWSCSNRSESLKPLAPRSYLITITAH